MTLGERSSGGRTHVPSAADRRAGSAASTEGGPDRQPDRHGEILDAALELFATIGYRATTMSQIGCTAA